jgi:hypothetical protein
VVAETERRAGALDFLNFWVAFAKMAESGG